MKNWHRLSIFLSGIVFFSQHLYGLEYIFRLFDKQLEGGQTFSQTVEKRISDLEKRKESSQEVLTTYKAALETAQKNVVKVKEEMGSLRGTEAEFASQKIDILNKTAQVLTELVRIYQEIQDIRTTHIRMLEEHKEDPEFIKKGFYLEPRSIYSIEDFQKVTSSVIRYDNELKILQDRLEKSASDSETLKENLRLASQELAEKQQEQRDLKDQSTDTRLERKKFTPTQRGMLLDLEERQLFYQQALAEGRLKKADVQDQLMDLERKILVLKLDLLRKQEDQVRQELRIDRKDIEASEAELKKQIDESTETQKKLNEQIEAITRRGQEIRGKIDLVKKRAALSDSRLEELYNWTDTPVTISQWQILIEIGRLHNYIAYEVEVIKDILLAQIALEKAKVTRQEVESLVITSWNSLTTGAFDGLPEGLSKEIKKYEKIQSDLDSSLAALADRRAAASRLLADNAQINQAIKERLKALQEQQLTTFKSDENLYRQFEQILKNEDTVDAQKRGEYITQLIELYSSISQLRILTNQKADMMLRALRSKAQSNLVPPLWNGVKKFIPDMAHFGMFLVQPGLLYKSSMSVITSLWDWVYRVAGSAGLGVPIFLMFILLMLGFLTLIYILLRVSFVYGGNFLAARVPAGYGIFTFVGGLVTIVIQFIAAHITSMYLWMLGYLFVRSGYLNPYSSVLFYLLSIILWFYYVGRFIRFAQKYNEVRNYQFASERYQDRFFFVLSGLLSATVTIFFLRHSLMTVLPQSDAPRILQALNFIILQVGLIFMISRQQIYRLIPQNTAIGKWLFELVDTFYYLFLSSLIFIIVMSNPYIGYGATFMYLIGRITLILLLIPLIVMLHNKIKSIFGMVFLESDEAGMMNERFRYARTSYGLLIIGSFLFFSAVAVLFAINIWGFSFGIKDIAYWFRKDLYGYTSSETGRRVAVNAVHLVRVFLNIVIGIAIAFFLTRFVLRRMFDLLLVKAGVQGIILSLSRYIIVLVALLLGLQGIGVGTTWMLYLLAIVGGLGVAGKDILADFIGYFMILIQRPVKIGDYVRIGPDLMGVVRQLTLRSVVLRRKNSVTLIIPNSYVLSNPLTNWNYYKMYFAFEDIFLTVPYAADPEKVRKIFLKVLHDNNEVLRNPAPIVRLNDFTDNGFQFMVRGYLSHDKVLDQDDIASEIRLALVKTLREHGYRVAVPTRILKIKEGDSSKAKDLLEEEAGS